MSTLTRHFDARITELKLVPGLSPAEGPVSREAPAFRVGERGGSTSGDPAQGPARSRGVSRPSAVPFWAGPPFDAPTWGKGASCGAWRILAYVQGEQRIESYAPW